MYVSHYCSWFVIPLHIQTMYKFKSEVQHNDTNTQVVVFICSWFVIPLHIQTMYVSKSGGQHNDTNIVTVNCFPAKLSRCSIS